MAYVLQQKKIAVQEVVVAKHQLLPDLHVQYFQGRNGITDAQTYPGIQVGIGVPLFFGAQKATLKIANQQVEKSLLEAENYILNRQLKVAQLQTNLVLLKQQIAQLEQTSLPLIQETKRIASLSLSAGETDFFDYLTSLNQTVELEMHYWQVVHQYNQTVLTLLFLD
jgi:cobalt-zinc-cadmium resistance protein CzcA